MARKQAAILSQVTRSSRSCKSPSIIIVKKNCVVAMGKQRHLLHRAGSRFGIFLSLVGIILLVSCGNGSEEAATPTAIPPSPIPTEIPKPTPAPFPTVKTILPCYTDVGAAFKATPLASPTPEVLRVQMLERPNRIVPSNIVLKRDQPYQLVIQAGNEWHQFRVELLGLDIVLPPGGEAIIDLRPQLLGVFQIKNERKFPESHQINTITVIPANMSIDSWHNSCAALQVPFLPPGAILSTPFVIEGSIGPADLGLFGGLLHVTRIEAWSNGEQVGRATEEEIDFRGRHSDFFVTVPFLPPGEHSVVLYAYLQNGMLVATASLPLTILPVLPSSTSGQASRGSIDHPADSSLLDLPVTIRGWAAIVGSSDGTGVGTVEIWDGPRESGRLLTEAIYGTYRPDFAQVFDDPRLASSGWFARLTDLSVGPLDLRLYVRDRNTGAFVAPFESEEIPTRQFTVAEGKVADASWPVALAAAPDGRLFYAELLTGRIRVVQDGQVAPEPFATFNDVSTHDESGFLGLALHPDFANNPYVYAMDVVDNPKTGLPLMQRVVRFRDANGVGQDYTVVLDNLPATLGESHNGGRIAFGPDGKLYVTIGDIFDSESSQDLTNLAGSILRYNLDGSVPDDNPLPGSPIYAYGFRNPFGIAIQPETGAIYATDNVPGGFDEVNRIEAGHNYGWPLHMGDANAEGFSDPIAVFGEFRKSPTYGPTGATFPLNRPDLLLFCAYHVPALHALELSGPDYTTVERQMVLSRNCILDVTASNDGWIYYSTISAIYRARLDDLLRLLEENPT